MRMMGIGMLRQSARRAWLATQPRAGILLYHRVSELSSDPQLLSVTPKRFAEHLEILRRDYHPISLQQLNESLLNKTIPHRGVVITFDDGYADNLYNAKPLLDRYEIPATVFVTTGYIGQKREFWWDELERTILLPESLPESLKVSINNKIYSWKIEGLSNGNGFNCEKYRYWNVTMNDTPTVLHQAYRELCSLLRPMGDSSRQKVLDELADWAGPKEPSRSDYRALSAEEVYALAEDRLIEVGCHTQTHPVMASLSRKDQIEEIQESKKYLESVLGKRVISFSYPYGSRNDYTIDSIEVVKDAGFICACSNYAGIIKRKTDIFQLPRFLVRNWDGDEFSRRLEVWFRG